MIEYEFTLKFAIPTDLKTEALGRPAVRGRLR
jgi:hypothetical protein